jgi:hypothetical protein
MARQLQELREVEPAAAGMCRAMMVMIDEMEASQCARHEQQQQHKEGSGQS